MIFISRDLSRELYESVKRRDWAFVLLKEKEKRGKMEILLYLFYSF